MSKCVVDGTIPGISGNIEARDTGGVIRSDCLYLHVYEKIQKIGVTALLPEGTYQAEFTELDILQGRKRPEKDVDDQWVTLMKLLLSGENNSMKLTIVDGQKPIDQDAKSAINAGLMREGRYLTQKKFYNANGDIKEEENVIPASELSLDVKTTGKLPITIGSYQLQLMREEEMDANPEETNLLNWMDLMIKQGRKTKQDINRLQSELTQKTAALEYYKVELAQTTKEHQAIMEDVEQKFYHVLNAKKDKIRELQGEDYSEVDVILDLNEGYRVKNKFSLDQKIIPVTDIPSEIRPELERPRRTKRVKEAGGEKKRRRMKDEGEKEEKENDDDDNELGDDNYGDNSDEDNETELNEETENDEEGDDDDDDDENKEQVDNPTDEEDVVDNNENDDNHDNDDIDDGNDDNETDIATDGASENESNQKESERVHHYNDMQQLEKTDIPIIKQETSQIPEREFVPNNASSTPRAMSATTTSSPVVLIKQEGGSSMGSVLQEQGEHRSGYETEDDPETEIDNSTEVDNSTELESESDSNT